MTTPTKTRRKRTTGTGRQARRKRWPVASLAAAAAPVLSGFGAVRCEADWQSSFDDTLGKAVDSAGNLRDAPGSWQSKPETAVEADGYTVG